MKYLFSLYSEYPKIVCTNLGVSYKEEEEDSVGKNKENVTLKESDYPLDFKVDEEYMKKAREKFKAFL